MRAHRDLVVHPLEEDGLDHAGELTLLGRNHLDVLGAHHHVDALHLAEALVHALEPDPAKLHQKVVDHDPVDDVALADEVGHKGVDRFVVDVLRRADLLDFAVLHHHHPVRHGQRLFLVVGDVDEGDLHRLLDPFELALHFLAQLEVQCTERLVEQQDPRIVDQGPRDRHALLLPTRELAHAALFKPAQVDHFEHLANARGDLPVRQLFQPQPEGDVLVHVQMWEERVALEHGVHRALVGRQGVDPLAVKKNVTLQRLDESTDDPQRRGFPTAGRPQKCDKFLVMDLKVQAV